mmetsp:Transcript_11256/g.22651  ORF Transcript_11256/g.22651 Transcript_11256/m.22651 type:complete len:85 (-) Transcript_11256:5735-5989(-)
MSLLQDSYPNVCVGFPHAEMLLCQDRVHVRDLGREDVSVYGYDVVKNGTLRSMLAVRRRSGKSRDDGREMLRMRIVSCRVLDLV